MQLSRSIRSRGPARGPPLFGATLGVGQAKVNVGGDDRRQCRAFVRGGGRGEILMATGTGNVRVKPRELTRLLERNAELRDVFAGDAPSSRRLAELQKWQSQRLLLSHADLRANPRYRKAVEFFFEDLYGGSDPRGRDRDLARVHKVMARLLPRRALQALCLAIELEVMSQELDADVVRQLPAGRIGVDTYAEGYRRAGRAADRGRQIELLGVIGRYLDGVVHKPLVHSLVRLAHGPAHAAGFGALQDLLERGLDAFAAMHGSEEFLAIIRQREIRAMKRVLARTPDPFEFGERDPVGTVA
jgi:hypothetical protein